MEPSDRAAAPDTDAPQPAAEALRLRDGVRVEVLDDEALALDPLEGVVHRLEGTAARIVADLLAGRTPVVDGEHDHAVVAALLETRIVATLAP
jgi:hypothetical protein